MVNLQNRIALVTGASRGIGRHISTALASCGAQLILSGRNVEKLGEVKEEIEVKKGEAVLIPADLAQEAEIIALFRKIRETFGRLDIVINNAGIGYFEDLVDFPMDKFDQIFRVNMRGTFLCCQQAMKIMIPTRSGTIINISSMQGIKGYPKQSAYAASKHGIIGMTKSLAAEAQKHNIRISVILPGAVDTELVGEARPELDRSLLIHPEDIAKTVIFLMSLSERAMIDMIAIRRSTASPF